MNIKIGDKACTKDNRLCLVKTLVYNNNELSGILFSYSDNGLMYQSVIGLFDVFKHVGKYTKENYMNDEIDKNIMTESYYIVKHNTGDFFNLFIIKATDNKDAIDKIFEHHFKPVNIEQLKLDPEDRYSLYRKKDFSAYKLDKYYLKFGSIEGGLCMEDF